MRHFFETVLVLVGPFFIGMKIAQLYFLSLRQTQEMTQESTSGPFGGKFLTEEERQTFFEPIPSHGFSELVKVKRQGRWFLLKGLKPEYRQQPVYLELLKKEYALMVQLDHPNIVKAYAKEMSNELGPCIVMEYIDGMTLDAFLESNPSNEVRRKVVDQLVDALAYIHSKQILHRDLKPSNVLITHNGNNVKIIDFGLSDADDYAILKQSAGTLEYMAPEQKSPSRKTDCRADVYAFGLLLGDLLPHRYHHIKAQCTRENPEKRYPDMVAVRKALTRSDHRRMRLPLLALVALMVPLLFLAIRTAPTAKPSDSLVGSISTDQQKYVEEVEWYINKMLRPIAEEAQKGQEYHEVLVARLSNTKMAINALIQEMSCLYPSNSQEYLSFLSMADDIHKRKELQFLNPINAVTKSYREDYGKGLLSQLEYDSLEWMVSPSLTTRSVTGITTSSATGGISILGKGYPGGVERGLCWGMLHNPTIKSKHACFDNMADTLVMTGLLPNTTYFVRAYISGSAGVYYGNEFAFTTLPDNVEASMAEGALPGLFSVAEGRQVWFSKGNLQYQASTSTWRFAEHQYDYVGKANENISATYSGWIDLFGWGTSGYDHGALHWQPWSSDTIAQNNAFYYAYGNASYDLNDMTGKADWGYNAISNGGNKENLWHTPSIREWVYLLYVRNTVSGIRYAKAFVNGEESLLILPDNWHVATYHLNSINSFEAPYRANEISLSDWQQMLEPAGAVLLPAAGTRTVGNVFWGAFAYHTANAGSENSYGMSCGIDRLIDARTGHRGDGMAVRLVRDVK